MKKLLFLAIFGLMSNVFASPIEDTSSEPFAVVSQLPSGLIHSSSVVPSDIVSSSLNVIFSIPSSSINILTSLSPF